MAAVRAALLALGFAGFAAAAVAQTAPGPAADLAPAAKPPAKASCIDPKRPYLARPLNNHEVYVETTLGAKKPPIRLSTSCYHLQPVIGFGFSTDFSCIGLGDTVIATALGERQVCRVTKVQAYVPQKDDLPVKAAAKSDDAKEPAKDGAQK